MVTQLNGSPDQRGLPAVLAAVLPRGYKFGVHHLSTPPTRTEALCSAPPDTHPDKTFVEKHFLAISIDSRQRQAGGHDGGAIATGAGGPLQSDGDDDSYSQVLVLAIEVFIFTTAYASTFFVSKADSTGYLKLLGLPPGTPSPIKDICGAFISFLVAHRRRAGIQCVVNLFARAQNQYLFPGSVENAGKHVLDDRGLVRWWCKVLDLLVERERDGSNAVNDSGKQARKIWDSVRGYLVVPGLDHYETRAFLPRHPPGIGPVSPHWTLGHPTRLISHYCREYDWVPPRCLIPRYPDDPKSRFRDELDAEADRDKTRRLKETGAWKSVRTVDEFWDMMAFRQECSSGRLTGFIWVVLDPAKSEEDARESGANSTRDMINSAQADSQDTTMQTPTPSASFDSSSLSLSQLPPGTPPKRLARGGSVTTPSSAGSTNKAARAPTSPTSPSLRPKQPDGKKKSKRPRQLTGPIRPRDPLVKTASRNYLLSRTPTTSAYYWWPADRPGRGQVVVDETGYKRSVELLLRLDFATLPLAVGSTRRWVTEVATAAGVFWDKDAAKGKKDEQLQSRWGMVVEATREVTVMASGGASGGKAGAVAGGVNNLTGLVKRKRPAPDQAEALLSASPAAATAMAGPGSDGSQTGERPSVTAAAARVNVLDSGLVRKKKKMVE